MNRIFIFGLKFQELNEAYEQITKLKEDLEMRERLFTEYRETKEREYTELLMIKKDLEVYKV